MGVKGGIYGDESSFEYRFISDYDQLKLEVENWKRQKLRIVLTQGSYDANPHVGHMRYLAKAKELGDILIVGVDSDEKVRARKGEDRPVVVQAERLEALTHLRSVDVVTLKEISHPHLHLLKTVHPDILVISKSTKKRNEEELAELRQYCGELVELEPQAESSTSAGLRKLYLKGGKKLAEFLSGKLTEEFTALLPELIVKHFENFKRENGG